MLDTLTGFAVVGLAILVGYIIGRIGLLGPEGRHVLGRLTFFVLSPFLLFVVLANADPNQLFSALLPVSAIAAFAIFLIYALVAKLAWRRNLGDTTIGALSAGQLNSNNFGIPLSLYLLGSAAYPAPIILLQLVVFTPIALSIMDAVTAKAKTGFWARAGRTISNPMIIGSVLGTIVALTGVDVPPIVMEPFTLIADACVPVLLISYGISLHGQKVLGRSQYRKDVILASVLKLLAMPVIAWALAQFVFGLSAHDVLIVTVLAALPTAQNVFNYSQRYGVAETISRDTVFVTTAACLPILFLIMLILGG